jgi:ribose 5-phosphate isomerase B
LTKKIILASDHAAADFIQEISEYLKSTGYEATILKAETAFTYSEAADAVVSHVHASADVLGIACCGTGLGISMRANRHKGIRATLIHDAFTAEMAALHSHANIICMGSRVLTAKQACALSDIVLNTPFEGGRHIPRLEQLDAPTGEK